MKLSVLLALSTSVAVSALTVNQPLLSRGTGQQDSDSWDDVPQSRSSLATEADPYESSTPSSFAQADPEDSKEDHEEKYVRPFSLDNGACKAKTGDRYVMEIKNVGEGSYYIGKMGFGTPAQELNMLLDTGSDEIVVKGKGCEGCLGNGFENSTSSTFKIVNPPEDSKHGKTEIMYGSGGVVAQRAKDTVSTGPLAGDDMDILVVEKTSISQFQDTEDTALEVIAGMAPGLPEYVGEKLASRMKVRQFSECLPLNEKENGFFVVNDDDPAEQGYNGPFKSMGNYYWALGVTDFRMEWKDGSHQSKKLGKQRSFTALADTGTTLLSVPQSVLNDLEAALDELDYDCSQMDKLPDLTFDIDGVTHKLPPSTYIAESKGYETGYALREKSHSFTSEELSQKRQNYYFKNKQFINKKTGAYCELLFTEPITMNSTLGEIGILGMPFFRNYIISFDFCSRTMYTKPSTGDCYHAVGQTPSNKHWCEDNHFLGCLWKSITRWFKEYIVDGLASIFTQNKPPKSGPRLKVVAGQERLSQMTQWLLKGDKQTVVEI